MPSHKFVNFGCWNQGLCAVAGSNPLSKVTRALREYTLKEHPTFIVVSGDNYYPGKVKNKITGEKVKTIIPEDLASGFTCLPQGVPIDMLLGNHDLETNIKQNLFIQTLGGLNEENDCFITKEEIALAVPNHIDLVVQKMRVLNNHTLLLLIDTSMYDDEDVQDMLPCYRKMAGYASIMDKDSLRAQQMQFVHEAVNAFQGQNILLIGHHPITGYKLKKDKIKLIEPSPSFLALLQSIFDQKGATVNYYYLCADLHLYQEGTVLLPTGMRLQQYIVGSGGTELDPDPSAGFEPQKPTESKNCSYVMTPEQQAHSVKEFGFLTCDYSKPALTFEFIKVPTGAGGSKKNKRSRSKKNKRNKKTQKRSKKNKKRKSTRRSKR